MYQFDKTVNEEHLRMPLLNNIEKEVSDNIPFNTCGFLAAPQKLRTRGQITKRTKELTKAFFSVTERQ